MNAEINNTESSETDVELLVKLDKDLLKAASILGKKEARFVIDAYYSAQNSRIEFAGKIRAMESEPHAVLTWWMDKSAKIESQIQRALKMFATEHHMGQWAMDVVGIGPVIASGLLAYIDIEQCPTVGHIWSLAGLNPKRKWLGRDGAKTLVGQVIKEREKPDADRIYRIAELAQRNPQITQQACADMSRAEIIAWLAKRPWNASLKVLCWKAGESFVKVSNNPKSLYGRTYKERKMFEEKNNEAGMYADQASEGASRVGKTTEAWKYYSIGKLPPGHIHARAKRYAVKLFLSHWHGEAYRDRFGTEPPLPYPIAHMGHTHIISPASH